MTATQPAPDSLGEVIATLAELDAKATPAPWRQIPLNTDSFIIGSLENVTVVNRLNNHNAALIVALRELSLPTLGKAEARIAELEALVTATEKERDNWRTACKAHEEQSLEMGREEEASMATIARERERAEKAEARIQILEANVEAAVNVADAYSLERIQQRARAEQAEARLAEAESIIERSLIHVASQSGAEHMMDGLGPRQERPTDSLLAAMNAFLASLHPQAEDRKGEETL